MMRKNIAIGLVVVAVFVLSPAARASASTEWRLRGRLLAPGAVGVRYGGDLHTVAEAARCAWHAGRSRSQGVVGHVTFIRGKYRGAAYTLSTPSIASVDVVFYSDLGDDCADPGRRVPPRLEAYGWNRTHSYQMGWIPRRARYAIIVSAERLGMPCITYWPFFCPIPDVSAPASTFLLHAVRDADHPPDPPGG